MPDKRVLMSWGRPLLSVCCTDIVALFVLCLFSLLIQWTFDTMLIPCALVNGRSVHVVVVSEKPEKQHP
jgi:hypothetical protein